MCGILATSSKVDITEFEQALAKLDHRGPDDKKVLRLKDWTLGFTRLAIMDLSHQGDQPFVYQHGVLICNGEIYNHRSLKKIYSDFSYKGESDCEVIAALIKEKKDIFEVAKDLDGEYAFVWFDEKEKSLSAARDPMGIRPLFYGKTADGQMSFASEVKSLLSFCDEIHAFPPGHIYKDGQFIQFHDFGEVEHYRVESEEEICKNIKEKLSQAVIKRLDADAPVGFLLSGGLDSSLVCSIAARHLNRPIHTFSVGMKDDAIDLKYARDVAQHIGSIHHEVIISPQDVLDVLPKLVESLETWDITTIRASVGMYLVCQYIREKTDIKVVLTGEVADEIFGYKYTDFAPDEWEFQNEAIKRVREIYMYDVLRADRSISAHSLEARVPFSDRDFVDYVMSIHPKLKMNTTGHGKYLLRKAFDGDNYLPEHILWRQKAAFSDAVGHSLADGLKQYADKFYDQNWSLLADTFDHVRPFTKESLLYRTLFEQFFKGQAHLIKDYWMPNKSWENCDVDDPSARILPNYGASGL